MELQSLITSRPESRAALGPWYRDLLRAADRDSVSVAQLATRLGCSRETLYAWRRRSLRPVDQPSMPAPAKLVRVKVADAPSPTACHLEVRLRSGHSVVVPGAFDPAVLAAVVEVLEQC